jgi:hypothetical protein
MDRLDAARRASSCAVHDDEPAVMTSITEIKMLGGERYRAQGDAKAVERLILDAARGSIMELAWLTDAETGEPIGVNPKYVVTLRALGQNG